METRAGQPPEGRLIEEARERLDISQNKAAKQAGISGTRWRQIVYGEASGGPGIKNPVHGNAETIAKMARAVKVSAEQLEEAGREDAAQEVVKLLREELGYADATATPEPDDPHLRRLLELWPQMRESQRRGLVGMLEEMLSESTGTGRQPDQAHERRTG